MPGFLPVSSALVPSILTATKEPPATVSDARAMVPTDTEPPSGAAGSREGQRPTLRPEEVSERPQETRMAEPPEPEKPAEPLEPEPVKPQAAPEKVEDKKEAPKTEAPEKVEDKKEAPKTEAPEKVEDKKEAPKTEEQREPDPKPQIDDEHPLQERVPLSPERPEPKEEVPGKDPKAEPKAAEKSGKAAKPSLFDRMMGFIVGKPSVPPPDPAGAVSFSSVRSYVVKRIWWAHAVTFSWTFVRSV